MSHLEALADAIGPRNVLRDPPDVAPYAVDWRGTFRGAPLAVLRPGTVEEVSAAVRACAAEGIAVVPAGGRTGLCGGAVVPENGPPAAVLSLERLNRIRAVDARDFSLVAEAGCVVQQVQEAAAAVDRLFPLSWGAQGSAQVGGALSTNAGGIRTLRWGNARDLVLGLEVVLPDGRVLNDLRRVRKDNSGYALRHLFLGGEGTLGIITAAALRLVPPLKRVETAFAAVPSPDAALSLLSRMLGSGAEVIAFELIGRRCMEIVDRYGQRTRMPMPLESPWYVMVEIAAAHPAVPLRAMLEDTLAAAMEYGECSDAVLAENEEHRAAFWRIREDYPDCARQAGPSINTDTAVPVSAVPAFLDRAESELAARWPEGRMLAVGHAGDGNMHVSLLAPDGMPRAGLGGARRRRRGAGQRGRGGSRRHLLRRARHRPVQAPRHGDAQGPGRARRDARGQGRDRPADLMNPGKVLP